VQYCGSYSITHVGMQNTHWYFNWMVHVKHKNLIVKNSVNDEDEKEDG
jgi:hypothetical protein